MKKTITFVLLALSLVLMLVPVVFAEEAAAAAPAGSDSAKSMAAIAAAIAIGVAAFGASIGQGMGLKGATEGIARNPGASGKITTTMIIGLAMIESLAIYALVVALILLFVNPFKI